MTASPRKVVAVVLLLAVAALAVVLVLPGGTETYVPREPGTLTFSRDIAPLIQTHCAGCHRDGQSAPFPLLAYQDVRRRALQIAEVTHSRYMPPWMPEPGYGDFAGARTLSVDQIGMLGQWAAEGAREGNPSDLPPPPRWARGWSLGEPDLVVAMPRTFTLREDGPDVYRNFVVPIPISATRYVKAVELDPGNPVIVHHAFMLLDRTSESRRKEEEDSEAGFDGIHTPASAKSPEGYFLSWQPGKAARRLPDGFSWTLHPRTDMVLQLHLQPSGKAEEIRSRIAFYFTDEPPKQHPLKIWLSSYDIDIPAGTSDYVLEESCTLPVDVDLLGILPHAHYLAKEVEASAVLPDGTQEWLLKIRRWDFNWQGDYRYSRPVSLPAGSRLTMRYVYDNSTGNPANPNHPPRRVRYGLQSTDEMGELWLQVLARTPSDRAALSKDNQTRVVADTLAYNRYLLRLDPDDARARSGLGKGLYFSGKPAEAVRSFQKAIRLDPKLDEPHYYLGLIHRRTGKLDAAYAAFSEAVRRNPENARALGNLGLIALGRNDVPSAETWFGKALAQNPEDALAHDSLGVIRARQGRLREAIRHFQEAVRLAPDDPTARQHLRAVEQQLRGR